MDYNNLMDLVTRQPVCSFATVDADQPRVRMFWTWFIDDNGIYFHTPKNGNAYQQMVKNPKVEFCYFEKSESDDVMIRVGGEVVFDNSEHLINRLLSDRPFLKDLQKDKDAKDVYGIFMLKRDAIRVR